MRWRLDSVLNLMELSNVDMLIVTHPPNVTYLTGIPRSSGIVLILERDGSLAALVPALDYWRAIHSAKIGGLEVKPYATYRLPDVDLQLLEPPHAHLPRVVKERGLRVAIDNPYGRVGFELERVGARIVDFSDAISDLRAVKRQEELELMRRALWITERAVERVLGELRPGLSEREVAAALEYHMWLGGSDGLAFETIVAFGANAAYPHATVSGRTLGEGEPVLIDAGAQVESYSSDITRTILPGGVSSEVRRAVEVVSEAVEAAIDRVREGVTAEEVDAAAREVVRRAGLAKYFVHSLGHGVGIEVHEKPRLAQGSKDVLKEGMIVTIEPGVYVTGAYGVRIENMVLVKKSGAEVLNSLPKVLQV